MALVLANRTPERASRLAADLVVARDASEDERVQHTGIQVALWTPTSLAFVVGGVDLVVNCTPVGMAHGARQQESPLGNVPLRPDALYTDLVYNPEQTPFLQAAATVGAKTLGGLPMLIYQGAEAFKLWTGVEAPVDVMFAAARKALYGS